MGDPKFPSKHYNTPSHPWQKVRMEQESNLMHQYGLKNKKEIWRADTKVREMRRQARKLTAKASETQAQKEKVLLLAKLNRLGMLEQDSALEDVLRMNPENILDRRLQTQVYLQGLSSTVKQARQLIVHGHISVDGSVTRVPGMTVTRLQEKNIIYSPSSALNSDLHPVRPGAKAPVEDEQTEEVVSEETKEKSEESDTKKEEKKPEEVKK
ncbi:MAG: 30S ribosomal protein S4 [Euryarchaeota archaeon]|mgnify:CR=1 FL=1|jgi:small subunit ribosomal protein S4|nr:30S ribosomal protein S4 [Euryarchaeota archaeon]|tara:strand:+ start:1691 stop:2323 length:633 start_codon:yes stop_codon:yes gene_type:complete